MRTQISPQRRRAVLAVAIGAIALDTALLGLIAPLLPEIERRIGATDAELGLALGAYALPILFVSLPLGRLADSIGRRPLLLGGMLLTVVGSLLIAVAGSLPLLLVGRAVQGVGSAGSWIAALALVSELARPGRKGEAIGFALAANSAGAIAGPALGGVLGGAVAFEFPFLLVAGIGAVIALAGTFVLPREPRRTPDLSFSASMLVRLAVSGPVLPATAIVVAASTGLGLVEVVAPLDADQRLGLSAATIGALFAATIALDAIAAPFGGRASDRHGRLWIALIGLAVVIASMGMLAVLGGTVGFVVGLSIYGIGSSIAFAAAVPWLDDAFGVVARGFGYGLLNLIYSIGYTLGPIFGGLALQAAGPAFAYGLEAALLIAVGLLALSRRTVIEAHARQLPPEPEPQPVPLPGLPGPPGRPSV